MAKLNVVAAATATVGATAETTIFAMLATLGLLFGMIFALFGIKIWWFKHRLTFDHSTTSNGAAGGSAPAVAIRPRSSKDKRLSQQFRQPVEVHGVFRKRQEDDFDIVPTQQLPPVRIRKLSQSTPSLLMLPKRRAEVPDTVFEQLQPPTREPPRPPVDSLPNTSNFTDVSIEMPSSAEFDNKFKRMELETTAAPSPKDVEDFDTQQQHQTQQSPPAPPHRLHSDPQQAQSPHKFVKARSASEPERALSKLQERRATGYLRPSEDALRMERELPREVQALLTSEPSVEEFGERRPTGYIKYAEIDTDGLDDFRATGNLMSERHHYEMLQASTPDFEVVQQQQLHEKREVTSPAAGTPVEEVQLWGDGQVTTKVEHINWETADQLTISTPESHASIDFTSDDEAGEGGAFGERRSMQQRVEERPRSWQQRPRSFDELAHKRQERPRSLQICEQEPSGQPATRSVQFATPHDSVDAAGSDPEEKDTLKMRRPTGYVRPDPQIWIDLEKNVRLDDDDKRLWLEIENEFKHDLVSNIEEEFNKIRNSYEENEGDFLEAGSLRRVPKQVEMSSPDPDGFGKSIDEDWESFEHLADGGSDGRHTVKFNLPDAAEEDSDKESALRTQRRPTGFIKNVTTLHKELEIADEDCEQNPTASSMLKERRPTGFLRPDVEQLEEEYVHEHTKENIFEPADLPQPTVPARKPKPRQKVTFDFSTTEYYTASDDTSGHESGRNFSDDDGEDSHEYVGTNSAMPKPMQRITKMQYTKEYSNDSGIEVPPTTSPSPVPILFGTQVSLEAAEADVNDSWAAIRQRRHINEEMQQQQSQQRPGLPMEPLVLVSEPPKPAYRNPLAQRSASEATKPVPHAQARKQYFDESYGSNITEA